jgi:hypothetical protein
MKWTVNFLLMSLLLGLVSCSSTKNELDRDLDEKDNDNIEREYKVSNASSNYRPGWIEDAEIWAKKYGKDTKKHRYFSYESTPKVDREIACSFATAKVKSKIAGEITTFIEQKLASSKEGRASIDESNPDTQPLTEYIENTLAQKTVALIHGAATIKTYWEKRKYKKDMGAKRDYTGYSCGILVRMSSDRLASLIRKAAQGIEKQAEKREVKDNVKNALKNIDGDFIKARQGSM